MPAKAHRAGDYLKSPEGAAAYLNAALEEMGDDPRLLMKALRNVAEAQGFTLRGRAEERRSSVEQIPQRGTHDRSCSSSRVQERPEP